jgi:hypothetical protein
MLEAPNVSVTSMPSTAKMRPGCGRAPRAAARRTTSVHCGAAARVRDQDGPHREDQRRARARGNA